MNVAEKEIAQFEARAETAYSAMYDARPRTVKDYYEDAVMNPQRAIDTAVAKAMAAEAERLTKRRDHIETVYNRQFRYVGR